MFLLELSRKEVFSDVAPQNYISFLNTYLNVCREVLNTLAFKNMDSRARMPGFKLPALPFGSFVPQT